jgi:hypothetical protein
LDPNIDRVAKRIHQKQLAMPAGQSYNLFSMNACQMIAEVIWDEVININEDE